MQDSGPWDPWVPVVENSGLFAQRTVHPLYSIYGLTPHFIQNGSSIVFELEPHFIGNGP